MSGGRLALLLFAAEAQAAPVTDGVATLPPDVKVAWDMAKAWRQTTPTRERVCLNGLWRWQPALSALEGPASADAAEPPTATWGWFKVPGAWPGITDYMHKDCMSVHRHPAWKDVKLGELSAAWYEREIEVPSAWKKRRIVLSLDTLNSFAVVHVDGRKAGELRFPGGELDLTDACRPGKHRLSLLVVALPLKGVMLSYADTARAKEVRGEVERRGLCGDAFLEAVPVGPRADDVRVVTSVRNKAITFSAGFAGLEASVPYTVGARIAVNGVVRKEFPAVPLGTTGFTDGRGGFTAEWMPLLLWDLDTPGDQFDVAFILKDAKGRVLDEAFPVRTGFREFWIEGRRFMLNGTPLHCSVLPVDNAQVSEALASYAGCRETFERLKAAGFNAVYTHNYGCEPGAHLGFGELLRAADDTGMLVFFSMPHFGQYEWKGDNADTENGYARDAAWYARVAGSHPSVVMYATSHNGCGYDEDMNPDLIGTFKVPRGRWSEEGSVKAMRAQRIIEALDPARLVYHHSAGDLGNLYSCNFYANFVPLQEMADWMGPWSEQGLKPAFLCEFGAPLTWDFAMYRGWYKGEREFGSAAVPWELCIAEWLAQYRGDAGYRISEEEARNLRWEAERWREGKGWHRWDLPVELGSSRFRDRHMVFAPYLEAEIRAFRTHGLSAYCLWDDKQFWTVRDGVDRGRKELPADWEALQRPGFSPDYQEDRYEGWDAAFARSDWTPTVAGEAILRNNRPLLAYIGGAPAFTSRDRNALPGDRVERTLVVINDSRHEVACEATWTLGLPAPLVGKANARMKTGEQARIPLSLDLPAGLPPGAYLLHVKFKFSTGETQEDGCTVNVLSPPARPQTPARIALFDPGGETAAMLAALGVSATPVPADSPLAGFDLLVIGKKALTTDGLGPDLKRVRDGLRVIVFEQTSAALEKRLGFRAVEYGLRQVFRRVPDSPALAGLDEAVLADWRGEATLTPSRLDYRMEPMHGPTVDWCGIPVSRVWRAGNRGSVASVLIEKPARGDFLPLLDGGFSLQFAPLLEFREGRGMVLFCQMDVTGRTAADPAADHLVRNLLSYAAGWKPPTPSRVYVSGTAGSTPFLAALGVKTPPPPAGALPEGTHVVAVGTEAWPGVTITRQEHVASVFDPPPAGSPFAGIGPADVHNRSPRDIPLVTGGASPLGNGVLAASPDGRTVFCQLAPWDFEPGVNDGLRRTYRKTAFLLNRIIANLGGAGTTPLLGRFKTPAAAGETRWLDGLYLDRPIEWDDPYRFFRW